MRIPAMIKVVASPATIGSLFAVYRLYNADGISAFVGYCQLTQLMQYPDAQQNSEFRNAFKPVETFTIELITLTDNEREAWEICRTHIATEKPLCNTRGTRVYPHLYPIICNETGEVFQTITEVCKAHGCSAGNLSNHLNNNPGFKSVKGRTYYRGNPPKTT